MKLINNFFKYIIPEKKKLLGRWNINYSKKYLDNKIYLANHDHCGPCGILKKNFFKQKKEN